MSAGSPGSGRTPYRLWRQRCRLVHEARGIDTESANAVSHNAANAPTRQERCLRGVGSCAWALTFLRAHLLRQGPPSSASARCRARRDRCREQRVTCVPDRSCPRPAGCARAEPHRAAAFELDLAFAAQRHDELPARRRMPVESRHRRRVPELQVSSPGSTRDHFHCREASAERGFFRLSSCRQVPCRSA